jgi:hypothetical protein
LPVAPIVTRPVNVGVLCSFGAAAQEQDHRLARSDVVNPVARADIDAQFVDALAKRLEVTEVALLKPVQSSDDRRFGLYVAKLAQPAGNQVFAVTRDVVSYIEYIGDIRLKTNFSQAFFAR